MELKLYIVSHSLSSNPVVKNLKKMLNNDSGNACSLEIINVLEKPELAEQDKIFATPTLIKISPEPVKRIVGDLSNKEKVFSILGL
jgi:circadian clock protein KaiB